MRAVHLPHDSLPPVADVGLRSGDAHLGTRIHRRRLRHLFLRGHSAWQQGTNEDSNALMRQHSEAHRTCSCVAAQSSTGGPGARHRPGKRQAVESMRDRDHGCTPRRRAGSGTLVYMFVLIVWVRAFRKKSLAGSPADVGHLDLLLSRHGKFAGLGAAQLRVAIRTLSPNMSHDG